MTLIMSRITDNEKAEREAQMVLDNLVLLRKARRVWVEVEGGMEMDASGLALVTILTNVAWASLYRWLRSAGAQVEYHHRRGERLDARRGLSIVYRVHFRAQTIDMNNWPYEEMSI